MDELVAVQGRDTVALNDALLKRAPQHERGVHLRRASEHIADLAAQSSRAPRAAVAIFASAYAPRGFARRDTRTISPSMLTALQLLGNPRVHAGGPDDDVVDVAERRQEIVDGLPALGLERPQRLPGASVGVRAGLPVLDVRRRSATARCTRRRTSRRSAQQPRAKVVRRQNLDH